jgi:hypothetical protein
MVHPSQSPLERGMTNMQFFFDLIWGQSRSRYLAEMGQMEAPND